MTWNNCPIRVTDDDFDPERHVLPKVALADIRKGEYVGLWITEMPDPITAYSLDDFDDLWALERVGIALEDAVVGSPIKVQCARGQDGYWVYKHKVAAKYLQQVAL